EAEAQREIGDLDRVAIHQLDWSKKPPAVDAGRFIIAIETLEPQSILATEHSQVAWRYLVLVLVGVEREMRLRRAADNRLIGVEIELFLFLVPLVLDHQAADAQGHAALRAVTGLRLRIRKAAKLAERTARRVERLRQHRQLDRRDGIAIRKRPDSFAGQLIQLRLHLLGALVALGWID